MNAVFVLVLLYVYCSKATLGIKTSSFCWSYGALYVDPVEKQKFYFLISKPAFV